MAENGLDRLEEFLRPYKITHGDDFRLANHDPRDTGGIKSKDKSEAK